MSVPIIVAMFFIVLLYLYYRPKSRVIFNNSAFFSRIENFGESRTMPVEQDCQNIAVSGFRQQSLVLLSCFSYTYYSTIRPKVNRLAYVFEIFLKENGDRRNPMVRKDLRHFGAAPGDINPLMPTTYSDQYSSSHPWNSIGNPWGVQSSGVQYEIMSHPGRYTAVHASAFLIPIIGKGANSLRLIMRCDRTPPICLSMRTHTIDVNSLPMCVCSYVALGVWMGCDTMCICYTSASTSSIRRDHRRLSSSAVTRRRDTTG
jgi:hypothetical protein